jgi:hypothetical protein
MDISEYRAQFASFNSSLELARFRYHVRLTAELNNYEINDRYSDLFSLGAIAELRSCLDQTPADFETERTGLQRLLSAARLRYVEAQAKELTEELAHCESSARIEWNGEKISLEDVPARLASEAKKTQRSELAARWADSVPACDELRIARLRSISESARELGFSSYGELLVEATNPNLDHGHQAAQSLLEETEPAYRSALAKLITSNFPDVSLRDLDFADLPYFEAMSWLDKILLKKDIFRTYEDTMKGLGIRVGRQPNVQIDTQIDLAARYYQKPACFPVSPPEDVRLAASMRDGAFLGFLQQAGKAQHYAWCSKDLAKRHPEFVYSADSATTEAQGYLFGCLPLDPKWLLEFLPAINDIRAGEVARDVALRLVIHVRRLGADVLYGRLLHDGGQTSLEQLQSTYIDVHERATSFRARPELFLLDLQIGMQPHSHLRALAFSFGLREYLRVRYGHRWWASRKAGDELIDLWNTASRYSVEELARHIGFGEINFGFLAEVINTALSGA